MAESDQVRKPAPRRQEQAPTSEQAPTQQDNEVSADLDDLLDEIDEVLETNAEEFVRSYVQKGGE